MKFRDWAGKNPDADAPVAARLRAAVDDALAATAWTQRQRSITGFERHLSLATPAAPAAAAGYRDDERAKS